MDIAKHPFFEPWTDPHSGVVSYLLAERVAPYQKALYYVTPSISADGRWLWFYACFPPSRQWMLAAACLDPDEPRIRLFPAAAAAGNPLVLPEGDAACVPVADGIYRVPFDGEIEPVVRLPRRITQNRHLFQLVTGLTLSADGKHFVLDSHIGNRWLISLADAATGEVTPLRWFARCHHHAYFSPVDPELILLGQGPWHDPITGDKFDMNIRMWLMDTKLTRYEPLLGDLWFNHNCQSCHEWWSADGMVCWCDYDEGVYECDVRSRRRALVWRHPVCHAQCDATKRFYCADENPYRASADDPCRVWFFDRRAGREIAVASALPPAPVAPGDRRAYHLDPHPHFSPDGRHVVYTTTARGRIDVAVAPVAGILERMQGT